MKAKIGKVYIVGAGPGDPELITLKGLNALKKADCILYDFLSNKDLLKFARKSSEKICVGKKDGLRLKEQDEINSLLYEKAISGKVVVRLKGGDPLIFSRGIDEALYLKKKNMSFEIIQGITSAFGASASFGIPLTRKGKFSSVAVLTGRKSNGKDIDAPDCDTLIYLMAVANIKNVVKKIIKSGKNKSIPCAFIENATAPNERIVAGNLSNIAKRAEKYSVKAPSIFIVGKAVDCGKRIYGHKYKTK